MHAHSAVNSFQDKRELFAVVNVITITHKREDYTCNGGQGDKCIQLQQN